MSKMEIPPWEKINITIAEASSLSSIGINEIRKKTQETNCDFVLEKGTHKLIKRKKFEEYLSKINVW